MLPCTVVLASVHSLGAQVQGQWTSTGGLQNARESNAQVLLATGKVLSAGGIDNNGNLLSSAEIYSSGPGTWALTGSMAQGRELFPAVRLASGNVLVSGGGGAGNTVLGAAELYNPTPGTWSPAGSLSVARYGHTATLLQSGKVLITGGCTSATCTVTAASELYDPSTNSWSATGSLNTARYYHTAVRLGSGKVLVIGGSTGSVTASCELYDPSTGTWSNVASLNVARYFNGTTLLPDGKVLVTGGTQTRFPINSAELYDPSANTWALTGNMTAARYAHTATLLTDGTVLVAGGEGQSISCGKDCTSYIPTASAEIYNETRGSFTATATLSRAQAYHSATLLANGRALAAGGLGTTSVCCTVINTASIYTPLTMTFSTTGLSFGVWQIGLTSPSQTVTVSNVSSHPVTFSGITSSGDFSQTNTCPTTLNAGQNCAITVSFAPTAAGVRNGSVTLKDNDPGSPTQVITLNGTGATNAITWLPASLSFPGLTPGTSSAMNITLYNDGTSPVSITKFAISPARGTFTQTNSCPAILNPNTSCEIQVTFTPPDTGKFSATLSVTDSDSSSPQTASLSGIGLNN